MTQKETPLSGYAILEVQTISQEMHVKPRPEDENAGQMSFSWDWRFPDGTRDVFDVMISLGITASQSHPVDASTAIVGRFQQAHPDTALKLEDFVKLQAVAILLPYVRQHIAALTQFTRFGPYHLPTLNVAKLMGDFDPSLAGGAKQLRESPGAEVVTSDSSESEQPERQ